MSNKTIEKIKSVPGDLYMSELMRRFVSRINLRVKDEAKKYNRARRLSIAQISRDVGVDYNHNRTIYHVFEGRRIPNVKLFDQLLYVTGMSIMDLITESELAMAYDRLDAQKQYRIRAKRDHLTGIPEKLPNPMSLPKPVPPPPPPRPEPRPIRPPLRGGGSTITPEIPIDSDAESA